MNKEWKKVKLRDVTLKIGSGSTPRGGSKVYLDEGVYALFRSQNILNNAFSQVGLVYINEEAANKLKNVSVEEGDVLLNITGDSVARVCKAPQKFLPARVNQHVAIIRTNEDELNSSYLNYYLNSNVMQSYMLSLASTGATRNALTKSMIENFEIPKPPLPTQKKIAHILSTLDDKIELNRQMNRTLEAMAQALFKSWFVDFDPVHAKMQAKTEAALDTAAQELGISRNILDLFPDRLVESEIGMVPEGWEVKPISEVSSVAIGKTPPRKESQWFTTSNDDIKWISIKDMGNSGMYILETNEYLTIDAIDRFNIKLIPANTVLLSFKLTLGRVAITTEVMTSNEAIAHFILENNSLLSTEYIYCHLKNFDYSKLGSTSSIATAINSKIVKTIPILVATEPIVQKFNEVVEPIFRQILRTTKEIQTLQKTRDTLLPKLLSGELDVSEMEVL